MSPYVIICRQCDVERLLDSDDLADVSSEVVAFLDAHGSHERLDITVDLTAGDEVASDRTE